MQEETKLPPNELPDGNLLEEKIKAVERQNETSMEQRIKDIKKGVGMLVDVKKKGEGVVINNSHHVLASISIFLYTLAYEAYKIGDIWQSMGYFLASLIAYGIQNILHTLKIQIPVGLADWVKGLGEKTGFARRG